MQRQGIATRGRDVRSPTKRSWGVSSRYGGKIYRVARVALPA